MTSGIDFTTGGILRFQEAWVYMYSQGLIRQDTLVPMSWQS